MVSLSTHFGSFFEWLVRTTLQAGLLVCLILLIQAILGHRLGVRGRYCLWLILLVRLALPWAPPSRFSAYNLLPHLPQRVHEMPVAESGRLRSATVAMDATSGEEPGPVGPTADGAPETTLANDLGSQRRFWLQARTITALSLCWLGGACILAGCIIAGNVRLWCAVWRGRPVTDRKILNLLQDCRRQMGIRSAVGVIATDRVGGPALTGLFRPRLLLPPETVAEIGLDELRYIFLHELAHLKRHDILMACLASLLHVLHWFNPLIAFGFQRMRADRELACDALALSALAPEETSAYGRTVVGQIEKLLASRHRPALIGLCGVRARTRQRVALIARFQKETCRWSPLTVALVGCLACAGLTDRSAGNQAEDWVAEPTAATWDEYARRNLPTTHSDKHANIQRASIRNRMTGKFLTVEGQRVTCDADAPGQAGLWEVRFDEPSNSPENTTYFYSVAAQKYLTSDKEGNLAVNADEPIAATRWAAWPQPEGVWVKSHDFAGGYLFVDETGLVRAKRYASHPRNYTNNPGSFWDVHAVWRIKTSDDPKSNPQWQREKIPGPDW